MVEIEKRAQLPLFPLTIKHSDPNDSIMPLSSCFPKGDSGRYCFQYLSVTTVSALVTAIAAHLCRPDRSHS